MRTEEDELRDDARAARLLAGLPSPSPAVAQRVRARVQASARPTAVGRGRRLLTVAVVTGALAASALLATRQALEPAPPAPEPVAAALEAVGKWAIDVSIPNVALSYDGIGEITGTSDAPRIRWDHGTINVEVSSGKGIALAVETREAKVRVVGTGFTVQRDALGTQVSVRHGRVEVDCGTEVTRVLDAGDEVTCLPRSAATLLGRARALQAAGGSEAEVLETLDRALAMPDKTPAYADEIAARRIQTLLALGRHQDALDAAQGYFAGPTGARRRDVELLAASAAVSLGGCATAAPWLLTAAPGSAEACGQ